MLDISTIADSGETENPEKPRFDPALGSLILRLSFEKGR
jgi:hypothetical protein